jgi:hypothetical protein
MARVEITRTPPRLEVDSTVPREEMGYFTPLAYSREIVAHSLKQAQRGIADIVAAGYRMAAAESGENAIAALAVERQYIELSDTQIVLTYVPLTPPTIRFIPGELRIDVVV